MYADLVKQLIPRGEKEKPRVEKEEKIEIRDNPYWTYCWCPVCGQYDVFDGNFCNHQGAFTWCMLYLRGVKLVKARPPFAPPRPHRPNGEAGKG
jgi:hypothetical protein